MRFTDRSLARLKARGKPCEVREGGGFAVRVLPTGTLSFCYTYDIDKHRKRLALGTWPEVEIDAARDAFEAARALKRKGIDPATQAMQARQEAAQAPTVAWLVSEYLERWAKPRKRSWSEDERILGKYVLPEWGERRARDITRRDVLALLDKLTDKGLGAGANRVFAIVRKMFNFAVSRDIVQASPCHQVKPPAPEAQRDRVLTEDEIRAFWSGLEVAPMSKPVRLALRLQLLTAQRIGEITRAEWSEVDLESGWWTIPAEKTKNGLAHRVPLSKMAREVVAEARWASKGSRWVFPSPRADKPIRATAVGYALRRTRGGKHGPFDLSHFICHDLRRTAASHMTSAGIPRLVVSKILNHVETGVTAVYDRHSYDREKREALERWADQLRRVLSGERKKVVSLQRRPQP